MKHTDTNGDTKSTEELKVVGTRVRKVDGDELVRGRAKFTADLKFPGMLHGFAARSIAPAGIITRIDPADALRQPDVVLFDEFSRPEYGPVPAMFVAVTVKV